MRRRRRRRRVQAGEARRGEAGIDGRSCRRQSRGASRARAPAGRRRGAEEEPRGPRRRRRRRYAPGLLRGGGPSAASPSCAGTAAAAPAERRRSAAGGLRLRLPLPLGGPRASCRAAVQAGPGRGGRGPGRSGGRGGLPSSALLRSVRPSVRPSGGWAGGRAPLRGRRGAAGGGEAARARVPGWQRSLRPPGSPGRGEGQAGLAAGPNQDLRRSSEDKALIANKTVAPELNERRGGVEFCTSTSEPAGWGAFERSKRDPFVGMEERWETQWQQFLKTLQPVHPGEGKPKMSEASPWEDPKAFLASFEQVAQACRWPREQWVACLLPSLSGEAEEAFQKLEIRDRDNYGKVKAAILKGEAVKMEAQRQRFRQFCCQEVEDPWKFYRQIQELCHQWLKPERHTKEQILELLILEQFLASLPPKLQSWVQPRRPDTCSQAVALVEDFLRNQQGTKSEASQGPQNEELTSFECAEKEPLEAVKREDVEVEISMLGHGVKSPNHPSSWLPSERFGVAQTALREEVMDLKERDICLQAAEWKLIQPVPKRMAWEVLQVEHRNVDSLKSRTETEIKVENPEQRGNEPGLPRRTDLQLSPGNLPIKVEMEEEGYKSREGCENQQASLQQEFTPAAIPEKATMSKEDKMSVFSQYDGSYHYIVERNTVPSTEKLNRCPQRFEDSFQHTSNMNQEEKNFITENRFEISENGTGNNLNHLGETHSNSPEYGKPFTNTNSLSRFPACNPEEEWYECSHCGKCFNKAKYWKQHQKIHTGEKPYKCSQCGKCFNQSGNLKTHQRIHTGERPYKCSQCGKCFSHTNCLKMHQRIHTGETYKCSQCGKCFRETGILKRHLRTHTGERPYTCSQCGKCFSLAGILKRHQRTHTGERPYKCSQCGKGFNRLGTLKKHQRIHTGEKPYKCSHCQKCFNERGNLKRHQRIHARENLNIIQEFILESDHINVINVGKTSTGQEF